MTKFNTGNPVGSSDPRDLFDNAKNFDEAVNNPSSATWTDRLGKRRVTLAAQLGYTIKGDYAAGIKLTKYNDVIQYEGEFYGPAAGTSLPYTTTTTFPDADSNLVGRGDLVLRQDLSGDPSDGKGAVLVAGSTVSLSSLADLVSLSGLYDGLRVEVKAYRDGYALGGGSFVWNSTKNKTEHDGVRVIDPTKTLPINWSNYSQVQSWFSPNASGQGCYERTDKSEFNLWDFGAVPGEDFSAKAQQSINLFNYVVVPKDEGWVCARQLTPASKLLVFAGLGRRQSVFKFTGPDKYLIDSSAYSDFSAYFKGFRANCDEPGHGFFNGSNLAIATRWTFDDVQIIGTSDSGSYVGGWDAPEGVISTGASIECRMVNSFLGGPNLPDAPERASTTTRTANGVVLKAPWNTTVDLSGETFIQGFKHGVEITNGWNCTIAECALENNFRQVVSKKDPNFPQYPSQDNFIKNCYIELSGYSMGGAGCAFDPDDPTNTAKYGSLSFQDNYHNVSRHKGAANAYDEPDMSKGNIYFEVSEGDKGKRQLILNPTRFQSAEECYSQGEQVAWFDPSTGYGGNGEIIGPVLSFRKDVNNNSLDTRFALVAKTSGIGNHADFIIAADQESGDAGPNSSEKVTSANLVTRMRLRGSDMYLSGGGAYNTSGADYAEMFEWEDGNPDNEDRVGKTVELSGDKIAIAKSPEKVIGVISATASVVGNNFSEEWRGKYFRDDFGRVIKDPNGQPLLSPEYDGSVPYMPRSERSEWGCVGLLGRLRVRLDSPVPDSWIKIREVSDSVVEYLAV
ncbi:MAG: hypothetical protein GY740_15490 [Gammaproteobacteria bacterium]|nr:hypothetical protein [Gammaproteobacteria bacterium]